MPAGTARRERASRHLRDRLAALLRGHRVAESADGRSELSYRIAQRVVRLRLAGGPPLAGLLEALEPLAVPDAPRPDAVVRVWCGAADGLCLPDAGDYHSRQEDGQLAVTPPPRSVTGFSGGSSTGLAWFESPLEAHVRVRSAPLLEPILAALRPHGVVGLHAAAVGTEQGGALLAGPGGAGKSTTAVACALAGLRFAAEDYCAVRFDPGPIACSLFASAKLTPRAVRWLAPPPEADSGYEIDGKRLYLLNRAPWIGLAAELPIRVVLLPQVSSGSTSRLAPVGAAEALRTLTASSARINGGVPAAAPAALFRAASSIVHNARCLRLELGEDRDALPNLVRAAIAGESAGA